MEAAFERSGMLCPLPFHSPSRARALGDDHDALPWLPLDVRYLVRLGHVLAATSTVSVRRTQCRIAMPAGRAIPCSDEARILPDERPNSIQCSNV
jgi:hypothetical protein